MFCHKCGAEIAEGSEFCHKCGTKVVVDGTSSQPQDISMSAVKPEPVAQSRTTASVNTNTMQNTAVPIPSEPKKKKSKKLLIGLLVPISVIIIIIIVSSLGDSGGNNSGNNINSSNKYVQMVKEGTLEAYPQTTVGKAFNDFMPDAKWESIVAEDGNRYVNVRGTIQYMEKDVKAAVQFKIIDDERFEYNAFEMNEIPQNNLMFWSLLEAVYEDSGYSSTLPAAVNSNEVISATFGSTFTYQGLEITIGNNWSKSQGWSDDYKYIEVPVSITNISDEVNNLRTVEKVWSPDGISITGYIQSVNEMRTGVTQNTNITFNYKGDGEYIVELFEFWAGMGFDLGDSDIIITLPITSTSSSQQASNNTSSGTGTADSSSNDKYPDEILYNDVPIIIIFELPIDEALAVFGTPVDGTESSLIYENIEVRMYNNKIVSMESFFPDKFAINGTSLETDRIGLIKLLGEPSSEGEGGSGYEMKFERNNYALTIATGDYEGTAWKIWINYYYGDDGSSDDYYNEDDSYPDEIIYNGKPLLNWLGSRLADLREEFGSPEVEGVIGEGGAYGFRYEDIEFVKYEQGEAIESISGMPSSLSINGITLNTNRNQLVSFFGNPVYEDWGDESYYASLGMENSYRISFNYQGKYSISFELDDPNGKAWSFYIYYNNNSFE